MTGEKANGGFACRVSKARMARKAALHSAGRNGMRAISAAAQRSARGPTPDPGQRRDLTHALLPTAGLYYHAGIFMLAIPRSCAVCRVLPTLTAGSPHGNLSCLNKEGGDIRGALSALSRKAERNGNHATQ